jgi:division/cell wall cluster transcriptional repressor MraZ
MAQVFMGSFRMQLDNKGRVGLPARYMSILRELCPDQNESVGVMITPDRSIKVMPYPYFLEEIERWSQLDESNAYEFMIRNMNSSIADSMVLDSQNRIKLGQMMMDLCGIELQTQVVVSGCMDHMQIYNEQVYHQTLGHALNLSRQLQQQQAAAATGTAPDSQQVSAGMPQAVNAPVHPNQGQVYGGWAWFPVQPMPMQPMMPAQTLMQSHPYPMMPGQAGFAPPAPPVATGFSQMGTPQQEDK